MPTVANAVGAMERLAAAYRQLGAARHDAFLLHLAMWLNNQSPAWQTCSSTARPPGCKYARTVGDSRSPGATPRLRLLGSGRVGFRCGQAWWSTLAAC